MPIVVKAVPKAEFQSWLAAQRNAEEASRTANAANPPSTPVAAATPVTTAPLASAAPVVAR